MQNAGRGFGRLSMAWRLAATGVVLALVFVGTLWGQDSAFPFGPFRMYSTRDDPNAPVVATRIEATLAGGRHVTISGPETGLRPAEVEGQLGRIVDQPALLGAIAVAYEKHNPGARLLRVEVVRRDYPLSGGKADGTARDTVLATWTPGSPSTGEPR